MAPALPPQLLRHKTSILSQYEFEVNSYFEKGPLFGLLKITNKELEYQTVENIQGAMVNYNGEASFNKSTGEIKNPI